MRMRFLKRVFCFVIILCMLLVGVCFLSTQPMFKPIIANITNTSDYIENMPMKEISPAIDRVTEQPDATKLIIGDSVCARLFNRYADGNPDYCVVGTNRGIVMSGQYILGSLFLETHPDATDIYLIVTTNTMITEYETAYGYQYAVQPFLESDNLKRLDDITLDKMKHAYGSFVTNKKAVEFIDSSPILKKVYLNLLNQYNPIYVLPEIPDTVERYIIKLNQECSDRGVILHLIPAPIAETSGRRTIEAAIEKSYMETEIYSMFPEFYNSLQYYSPEYFEDGIHPKADQQILHMMIRDIQKNNSCLEDFILQ